MPIDMKAAICRSASELLTNLQLRISLRSAASHAKHFTIIFRIFRILSATLWSKVLRSFWKIVLLSQRLKIKFVTC